MSLTLVGSEMVQKLCFVLAFLVCANAVFATNVSGQTVPTRPPPRPAPDTLPVMQADDSTAFWDPDSTGLIPFDSLNIPIPDSAVARTRQVGLNPSAFLFSNLYVGQQLNLNLFDDVDLVAVATRVTKRSETYYRWIGRVAGARFGSVVLGIRDDRVMGNVRVNGRLYQIRPQRQGMHLIIDVNMHAFPPDTLPNPAEGSIESGSGAGGEPPTERR